MKNSWIQTFRRLAATTVVAGTTMYSSAMCYANAFDVATNPPYADGWQAGDNGGTGFTPWDFSGSNNPQAIYGIDSSSPFNNLGTAWRMAVSDSSSINVARAGRGFAPLQVGDTLSVVFDNPTPRQFFHGYTIGLNSGGGNTPATGAQEVALFRFEYFNYGLWQVGQGGGDINTTLFDTDTALGARVDFTLTSPSTYSMTLDPFGPAATYTHSGSLKTGAPINWVQFDFYNTATNPSSATDMYISSVQITGVPEPATFTLFALGAAGVAAVGIRRKK